MKKQNVFRSLEQRDLVVDAESRTVELSFASDFPVDRYDWVEVLDVRGMSLDRIGSGRAALLVEHDRRDQVGVIESVSIGSDNIGRAKVRFSKSARGQEIFQDVVDGIRSLVSFGYSIDEVEKTGERDGTPIYTVKRFSPYEISIVSIPADPSVGAGRAADMDTAPNAADLPGTQVEDVPADEDPQGQRDATASPSPSIQVIDTKESHMDETIKAERQRAADILALGTKHGAEAAAREFVAGGKSVDEFRAHLLDSHKPEPVRTSATGMSNEEARSFSFLRMLEAQASGDWSKAGFEREAVQAAAKALGRSAKGAFVPLEVMALRASQHTVGTPADGGNLVATELRMESFIEALRSRLMVRAMGATVLDGLVGNLQIPKQTGLANVGWVGEDGSATNTKVQIGQVPMSPKTAVAKTSISRRLMLQTSMSMEAFIRAELQAAIAKAVDRVALVGGGTNEPVGLLGGALPASRKVVVGADGLSWAEIVAFETAVATADADVGRLAYLTSPAVRGQLKTTEKAAGTAQFIWNDGQQPGMGLVNGYAAGATTQLGADQILFGNFADLVIGFWSGTDIVVDNITDDSGAHIVKVFQDVDCNVRHAQSFAYGAAA